MYGTVLTWFDLPSVRLHCGSGVAMPSRSSKASPLGMASSRLKASKSDALARARRVALEAISPHKQAVDVTIALHEPASGKAVQGEAAIEAAQKMQREVIPTGTRLSVFWSGSDEWYEAKVIAYRAVFEGGNLIAFKHKVPSSHVRREPKSCSALSNT